jgi:magnesium chelatase subunit D
MELCVDFCMICSGFVGHARRNVHWRTMRSNPCGGVLFAGEKGSGKSRWGGLYVPILPAATPFVVLPMNVLILPCLARSLSRDAESGKARVSDGLFSVAHGGVFSATYPSLANVMSHRLEVHGRGEYVVVREGMSPSPSLLFHPCCHAVSPGDGEITPHLLDRLWHVRRA